MKLMTNNEVFINVMFSIIYASMKRIGCKVFIVVGLGRDAFIPSIPSIPNCSYRDGAKTSCMFEFMRTPQIAQIQQKNTLLDVEHVCVVIKIKIFIDCEL